MRYLVSMLGVILIMIALACSFNWLVDPFGRYWSPVIPGFNDLKPEAGNRVRVSKAYRAPETSPEVLLVGNSRVEMGLFPGHALFGGKTVYNIAMPGAGVGMQVDYALNTIRLTGTVETLIIGVDVLDFLVAPSSLGQRSSEGDFHKRLQAFAGDGSSSFLFRLREQAAMVFSLDSLFASIKTVLSQAAPVSSIDRSGFNTAQSYEGIIRAEGVNVLFVQKLQELRSNLAGKNRILYSETTGARSPDFEHLQRLVDEARQRSIQVHVFISPYHYSYLHVLQEVGLTEQFWRWKALLVNQLNPTVGPEVPLWDFSIFSDAVLEPVPLDKPERSMQWYWEPAHYKRELGDRMLSVMLTGATDGLAVALNKSNIDQVVDQGRSDLEGTMPRWLALKQSLGLVD